MANSVENSVYFNKLETSFLNSIHNLDGMDKVAAYRHVIVSLCDLSIATEASVMRAEQLFNESVRANVWKPRNNELKCRQYMVWTQATINRAKELFSNQNRNA